MSIVVLNNPYREDIFATGIDACALHLCAPREVNVLLSDRTMQNWDSERVQQCAANLPPAPPNFRAPAAQPGSTPLVTK